ncbi:MAG: hydrogen gas-evolving membrane-bound hydrogenase subunit E, partial [Planctomycetota bacterium]|nr:hydrogen gas-evolving membrane-bound hydrogenase subunit E [Planctomycetota bacterium]
QAPDLALTQLMFEIISVVLFLLVLRMLPEEPKRWHKIDRIGRALFGIVVGVTVGWIVLQVGSYVDAQPGAGKLGQWFTAQSYTDTLGVTDGRGGGGNNIVNVILVDFRGYDTLGEITVLTIAVMGVFSLINYAPAPRRSGDAEYIAECEAAQEALPAELRTPLGAQPSLTSSLFRTGMRLLLPLALIFAGYVFFKGHNEPGGGFIAGLVASVALAVYRMAEGPNALKKLLPIRPGTLAVIGLAIALVTAVAPMILPSQVRGEFLQSYNGYIPRMGDDPYHWASPMFFDIGVFLVVIAVSVGIVNRLTEELE